MKDVIILENARKKKILLESIADRIKSTKMAQALNFINFAWKYK